MSRAERQAAAQEGLAGARAGVIEETGPVVHELLARVGGTLRFNQGRYDSCGNDLSGPTAYSWSLRGRIDLGGGTEPLAAVSQAATVLREHGFTPVDAECLEARVVGTKGPVRVMVETLAGAPALVFTGSDPTCFELGRERARAVARPDPDPLG